ncbi:MAG: hypothetical protein ACREIC_07480, partial [Limisphaerales bacterium]
MPRPAWARRKYSKRHPANYTRTIIAKSAISTFLARPREDFEWIKKLPDSELRPFVMEQWNAFALRPWLHQLAGFAVGMEQPQFLFNFDMGLGKTSTVLS